MSNETFSSEQINEHQIRLNNLDWGGGKKVVPGKKPKGTKVFTIRLVDKEGEKRAVVTMNESN